MTFSFVLEDDLKDGRDYYKQNPGKRIDDGVRILEGGAEPTIDPNDILWDDNDEVYFCR